MVRHRLERRSFEEFKQKLFLKFYVKQVIAKCASRGIGSDLLNQDYTQREIRRLLCEKRDKDPDLAFRVELKRKMESFGVEINFEVSMMLGSGRG